MKLSSFFITRPIFAVVLSVGIVIAGGLALLKLPISEYPAVVPPTVIVRAAFPGANPKVIAETVAAMKDQMDPDSELDIRLHGIFATVFCLRDRSGDLLER